MTRCVSRAIVIMYFSSEEEEEDASGRWPVVLFMHACINQQVKTEYDCNRLSNRSTGDSASGELVKKK